MIKSEPDRYGFSVLLARRLGLKRARRSYCAWVHGWMWWGAGSPEELAYGGYAKDIRIVCTDENQRRMLAQHGYTDVVVGGLPFAYVQPTDVKREKGSLLVFLPHSLDYFKVSLSVASYLDFLATLRADFSRIDVCIYSHDYDEGTQKRECEERGLNPIRGAHAYDVEALTKLRTALERCEYVTTPSLGSHVVYAAFCGCKVSITRPIFGYREEHFANDPYYRKFPFLARLYRHVSSEEYISSKFPWLLTDHPGDATACVSWATKEIGAEFVLDDRALKSALGWDAMGRIWGPIMGAKRRILRRIIK